ncbi:hypothetical protein TURU_038265 [Turdus rufiventris]|nr:hypothetical protein TURU_038265 [Turdus rufiventris]
MEHRAALAVPSPLPPLLLSLPEPRPPRRLDQAFHCQLKGHVLVDKKTLVELQNFQSVRGELQSSLLGSLGIPGSAGWKERKIREGKSKGSILDLLLKSNIAEVLPLMDPPWIPF